MPCIQGEDNVSQGVLGGTAPHKPSPWAVPRRYAQSRQFRLFNKVCNEDLRTWASLWQVGPYYKELAPPIISTLCQPIGIGNYELWLCEGVVGLISEQSYAVDFFTA